jgi:hypothetical protein
VVRRVLPVPIALLVIAGCGGAGELKNTGPDDTPCPAGVRELKVKDVLPEPPPGFKIVAPEPSEIGPIRHALRERLGHTLRSLGARTVINRDDGASTHVFVLNNHELWLSRDVLLGADQVAERLDAEPEKLTIAGDDGLLVIGPSAVLASGSGGDCAGVMVLGSREADVRAIAAKIRRAQ